MRTKVNAAGLENARIELEEKYYQDIDELHEKYDVYLHDMKHTMRTIAALAEEERCDEIRHLISEMQSSLDDIQKGIICSHKILNALFQERRSYAEKNHIILKFDITEPVHFHKINDLDLIALMGNLLDNAIEAEKHSGKQEGILCCIWMAEKNRHLLIELENSFDRRKSARPYRSNRPDRIGEKHGIGIKSVREIVKKYGGIYENEKGGGRYWVKIILPMSN